jgi:replicative DNA helicase
MFIFRQEYYESREPTRHAGEADNDFSKRYDDWKEGLSRVHGLAEVLVAKQRHGPIGEIKLRFAAETTKFESYSALSASS